MHFNVCAVLVMKCVCYLCDYAVIQAALSAITKLLTTVLFIVSGMAFTVSGHYRACVERLLERKRLMVHNANMATYSR